MLLLRRSLYVWLIAYLAILFLIGLIAAVRVVGILRKECRDTDSDRKENCPEGHPLSRPLQKDPSDPTSEKQGSTKDPVMLLLCHSAYVSN